MTGLATFLLLLISLACRTTVVDPEELVTADRRFQAETAERGTSGWVDAVLDSPDYSLTWEPEFAEASGDLGYTYGTYTRATSDTDGNKAVETGLYVTVWRRNADGAWKAVV